MATFSISNAQQLSNLTQSVKTLQTVVGVLIICVGVLTCFVVKLYL